MHTVFQFVDSRAIHTSALGQIGQAHAGCLAQRTQLFRAESLQFPELALRQAGVFIFTRCMEIVAACTIVLKTFMHRPFFGDLLRSLVPHARDSLRDDYDKHRWAACTI